MPRFRIFVAATLLLATFAPNLQPQGASTSRATLLWTVDAERGGPTTKPGPVAVSPSGAVAFTRGADVGENLVTLLDRSGKLVTHFVRRGSGPGEFQSVFALFFSGDRLYAYGPPQISAFDMRGRHQFSRAVPPASYAMAVAGDSVDLLDLSGLRTPGFLGEIRRKSLALNGGDRVLIRSNDAAYRVLAAHPTDSGRFLRIAYGTHRGAAILANPYNYRIQRFGADGGAGARIGSDAPLIQLTGAALEREIQERLAEANRPFKLPDGTTRPMPDRSAEIRRTAAAPRSYFSDRLGGFNVDDATGEIRVVETATPVVRLVSINGEARTTVEIPCDARGANASVNGPFLAVVCAKGGEGELELRLYRIR